MIKKWFFGVICTMLSSHAWVYTEPHIVDNYTISKHGVDYVFVPYDQPTDFFVTHHFANWEDETFQVFEQVKDLEGVAIDLGAWIGTTAIWCCKNFAHVVAVDADLVSLQCLKNNLQASCCDNVTICDRPVAPTAQTFFFGPRGTQLNESISHVKDTPTSQSDYKVQGLTFKQLIHDFVYENDAITNKKVSFIKCDIEGGEENILEDVLYFAYHNNVKVYMSFHISWWKHHDITEFEKLFRFFTTNCPSADIIGYLQQNPFASILFEPLQGTGLMLKSNMPVVIIAYNQLSYIKQMVSQLEKYTTDIIVVDNHSTYQPLLDYYRDEFAYTLLSKNINYGHRVVYSEYVQNLVGDMYIITDPDLLFNPKLPDDFISKLQEVALHFDAYKVGFALSIDSDNLRTDVHFQGHSIQEWESRFWDYPLRGPDDMNLELYEAPIDTTFCLVHKKHEHGKQIRVAGDYACLHLPWFINFKDGISEGEYASYLQNNISTSWYR